jgi:hypothetical protein
VHGEHIAAARGMKTRALSRIIHRLAAEASLGDNFSSHSLRRPRDIHMVTAARRA